MKFLTLNISFERAFVFYSCFKLQNGKNAASLHLAEQYIDSFGKLAKTNNTMILSNEVNNVPSLISQVNLIYYFTINIVLYLKQNIR